MVKAAALLAAGALAGCSLITDSFLTNDFSGDSFPTRIDGTGGALRVGMQPLDGPTQYRAVLDLLSPFTLLDPGKTEEPTLTPVDLMLLGENVDGTLTLPRARFPQAQLIALHPCAAMNDQNLDCAIAAPDAQHLPTCAVGTPGNLLPFDGVIGADVLAGDAIRLRLADDQIFVLADIGGNTRSRSLSCEAVFDSPYRGGGTLVISGTELPFGNRRIALSACLGQARDPGMMTTPAQQGADALFVVSTSIGISIIDEAAYQRYRLAAPGAPDVSQLPADTVCLPSGLVTGRRATIDQMALVGASISNGLSPCRQIYAHHQLADGAVAQNTDPNKTCDDVTTLPGQDKGDCPCKDGSSFCAVPTVLELTPSSPAGPTGIDVLVVPDTEPTLQSLRTELRPDQPEVDGLLGTDVLRDAEIDVDYPHDRLIARCIGGRGNPNCKVRPQLTESGDRCQINHCIYGPADNVGCPTP
ncbi:MAG TPA: hypothetical protein VHW23_36280 [Kofleriaceae bacterium]|nr:hypothetical protein [Kofleriaceae bacterium]